MLPSPPLVDPSAPANEDDLGLANLILTNGARFYVDHAHPEYSTPRGHLTARRRALGQGGGAGHRRGRPARAVACRARRRCNIYKNNTDNKGVSYGCHENYLMSRKHLLRRGHPPSHAVLRQPPGGLRRRPGRASAPTASTDGFQLSQRADFFEVEVGLETTLKRPIINTRDEPHADPEKYRRLHVIIGDANLSELSTYLKVGTTSLVIAMIEAGWLVDRPLARSPRRHAAGGQPRSDARASSVTLRDGRTMTAMQLQMEYLEQARKFVEDRWGSDADEQTRDVLTRWEITLVRLETEPMSLSRELDWVAKLAILEGYRERDGLDWSSPRLQLVDLQYSDVRQDKGLYNRLVATGRFERLVSEDEVERAMTEPPEDTRAYFRGRCLAKYASEVSAASWDSVIFDVGRETLQRVPTMEPLRGTTAHVGELLDRCATRSRAPRRFGGRQLTRAAPVDAVPKLNQGRHVHRDVGSCCSPRRRA